MANNMKSQSVAGHGAAYHTAAERKNKQRASFSEQRGFLSLLGLHKPQDGSLLSFEAFGCLYSINIY